MSVAPFDSVGWGTVTGFWIDGTGEFGVSASGADGGTSGDIIAVSLDIGHLGLAAGITQLHVLRMANAVQGVSADPAVFGMAIVPGTFGHTVAAPGLTQLHILPAVAGTMGHTATIALQGVVLQSVPATMGHTATQVTDIEQSITATPVTPVAATMIHNGLGVGITQRHVLVPVNAILGNVAGG
jgi:hypothetical protein